ncbi:hypothetical protein DL765_010659 [Monosporascus sp. GIB2]|nr:hypothetical protein DL765_010659 [Monosporascus sp. GIB2]
MPDGLHVQRELFEAREGAERAQEPARVVAVARVEVELEAPQPAQPPREPPRVPGPQRGARRRRLVAEAGARVVADAQGAQGGRVAEQRVVIVVVVAVVFGGGGGVGRRRGEEQGRVARDLEHAQRADAPDEPAQRPGGVGAAVDGEEVERGDVHEAQGAQAREVPVARGDVGPVVPVVRLQRQVLERRQRLALLALGGRVEPEVRPLAPVAVVEDPEPPRPQQQPLQGLEPRREGRVRSREPKRHEVARRDGPEVDVLLLSAVVVMER